VLHPEKASKQQFSFDTVLNQRYPTLNKPTKLHRPICIDYGTKAHCPRGMECPDRHVPPPVPMGDRLHLQFLICKHYQRGLCKKGDACEFGHMYNLREERECKEFGRHGVCPMGESCTYLHMGPTSPLRDPACPHYTRGFCPLGPHCSLRHVKHEKPCPFYMAGFCPNGRAMPPGPDRVVGCEYGAHARWIKDEDMHPPK
ncbi:hypothetical protein K470DRAFT_195124, partial [Piedraia hortae CBS 480.64]